MTDIARTMPTDLQEVATRHHAARQLTLEHAAKRTTTPHVTASIWQQLAAAFADTPNLVAEITQLRACLAYARLDRANLAAAALAAITAHQDGEPDPLSYLRDELRAQGHDPARSTREPPRADAQARPPNAPVRPAANDRHQLRRRPSGTRDHRDHPVGVAVPIRTRPAHARHRRHPDQLGAARHPLARLAIYRGDRRAGRSWRTSSRRPGSAW